MGTISKIKQEEIQLDLGLFPGMISSDKGEAAPRLKASIAISLTDRKTGEKFVRHIPFETDEASHLLPWVMAAVSHRRFQEDVEAFSTGRNG